MYYPHFHKTRFVGQIGTGMVLREMELLGQEAADNEERVNLVVSCRRQRVMAGKTSMDDFVRTQIASKIETVV